MTLRWVMLCMLALPAPLFAQDMPAEFRHRTIVNQHPDHAPCDGERKKTQALLELNALLEKKITALQTENNALKKQLAERGGP